VRAPKNFYFYFFLNTRKNEMYKINAINRKHSRRGVQFNRRPFATFASERLLSPGKKKRLHFETSPFEEQATQLTAVSGEHTQMFFELGYCLFLCACGFSGTLEHNKCCVFVPLAFHEHAPKFLKFEFSLITEPSRKSKPVS
jgi:hypothetical protein